MIDLRVILEGDGAFEDLLEVHGRPIEVNTPGGLRVAGLEGGMQSGLPSVAIAVVLPDGGWVFAQTSLRLFLTAADALKARYGELNTDKSIAATRRDIGDCMRKWRCQEWDLMTGNGRAVLTYTIRARQQEISCTRFPSAEQNARALYGLVDALRLADQRGMLQELADQATALLSAPIRARPAHEVLRVFPDAPLDVCEAAYKALAKTAHPDAGGTEEAMKELNEAIEAMRKERQR